MEIFENLKEDIKELESNLNILKEDLKALQNKSNKEKTIKSKDWYYDQLEKEANDLSIQISKVKDFSFDDIILFLTSIKENDLEVLSHLIEKYKLNSNYVDLMKEFLKNYGNK